jgi:hypothetical protein
MLRRFLIVMLVIGLAAGLMAPGQAASAGMDCEQVSLQSDIGCGAESMAATCAVPCPAGACTAPALLQPQATKTGAQPFARAVAQASDGALAPDTAPPKHSIV